MLVFPQLLRAFGGIFCLIVRWNCYISFFIDNIYRSWGFGVLIDRLGLGCCMMWLGWQWWGCCLSTCNTLFPFSNCVCPFCCPSKFFLSFVGVYRLLHVQIMFPLSQLNWHSFIKPIVCSTPRWFNVGDIITTTACPFTYCCPVSASHSVSLLHGLFSSNNLIPYKSRFFIRL